MTFHEGEWSAELPQKPVQSHAQVTICLPVLYILKQDEEKSKGIQNMNRPFAGARFTKDLPEGDAPIQLYSLGTPNGVKVRFLGRMQHNLMQCYLLLGGVQKELRVCKSALYSADGVSVSTPQVVQGGVPTPQFIRTSTGFSR